MFNVGGGEVIVILLIALIVLGPDKLPGAARQVGKYLNEFRRISSGFQDEIRSAMDVVNQPTTDAPPAAEPTPDVTPADPAPADSTPADPATAEATPSAEPPAPEPASTEATAPVDPTPTAEPEPPTVDG